MKHKPKKSEATLRDLAALLQEIIRASATGQAPSLSPHLRGLVSKAYGLACSLDPSIVTTVKPDADKWKVSSHEIDAPDGEAAKCSHYLQSVTGILCHHLQGRAFDGDEIAKLLKLVDALDGGKAKDGDGQAQDQCAKRPWSDDAPGFMLISEALTILECPVSLKQFRPRLLAPDGLIWYMTKGRRTKVYLEHVRQYLKPNKGGTITDAGIEAYLGIAQ